jgi:hypothetical protein
MRIAVGIGVIVVALSAAIYVHQRKVVPYGCAGPQFSCAYRKSWHDPVTVLIGLGGLAMGAGIVLSETKH